MKSYILRFIATSGRHSSHDMGGLSILVGLSLPAGGFAADEIIKQVGVVLRAIDALFGARLLGRGHELGAARSLGNELHPAGFVELQGEPDRFLERVPRRGDAVIAEED